MYAVSSGRQKPYKRQEQGVAIEEGKLVEGIIHGNRSAFQELVEMYKDRVFNTCLGFLRNPQDAEDVSQEVFVQVYHSISDFRKDAALSTWIYRIAVNKSMELIRYRKRQKRQGFFKALADGDADPDEISNDEYFNHPGLALEQKERAGILYRQIEQLPENQRIAFTLNKVEGLSYQEVADVMDMSNAAVESLIYRGKENLKKYLYSYYQNNEIE